MFKVGDGAWSLSVPGHLTNLAGQFANLDNTLALGAGGGCSDIFSLPVRMYRKSDCTTSSVSVGVGVRKMLLKFLC